MRQGLRLLPLLLLFGLACAAPASVPADYAGQYVLRLGARNFLVLNLHSEKGNLIGTLSRPRHSSLGTFFTSIGSEIITEPILTTSLQQDHLHLVAGDPHLPSEHQPSDSEAYDLTLLPQNKASLQLSDIPIDAWELARVPASPLLAVATDWDPDKTYFPDETKNDSPEMDRIIAEDQKPRQVLNPSPADWVTINQEDGIRRTAVRRLLAEGALHTGKDFSHAAFVFQHGGAPEDYLLAHTLAMIAIARGDTGALWIATATLDRYLQAIKQPQIYGTQFNTTNRTPWTQEPYNRAVISDDLRRKLGVPSQAAQTRQLEQYKNAK